MGSDYPRGTCENVVYHFHGTIQIIIPSYLRPVLFYIVLFQIYDLSHYFCRQFPSPAPATMLFPVAGSKLTWRESLRSFFSRNEGCHITRYEVIYEASYVAGHAAHTVVVDCAHIVVHVADHGDPGVNLGGQGIKRVGAPPFSPEQR